jgi:hypothetical protein
MRFKELPNEPRNLLGYFVKVRARSFGILVQSNTLLNTCNGSERKGDGFHII